MNGFENGLLYPLTFDTCTSVFSNDIDEQLWIDSHHYSDSSTPDLTAEYATMAKQTSVGLLKDGTGALYLTGTNVYKGDTVIRGGTLGISKRQDNTGGKLDGSNVYVEKAGTLTGDGNLTGIVRLVTGMKVEDVIAKLKGIPCEGRDTSCPDQLARALEHWLSSR